MRDTCVWRTKMLVTIAIVLVAFVGLSLNTSLQATLCDSNQYTVTDTEDNCTTSCRAPGEAACNAKFGYQDDGSPCTNFQASYVHQADDIGNNKCSCIMDCEVSSCYDNEEDCPL